MLVPINGCLPTAASSVSDKLKQDSKMKDKIYCFLNLQVAQLNLERPTDDAPLNLLESC